MCTVSKLIKCILNSFYSERRASKHGCCLLNVASDSWVPNSVAFDNEDALTSFSCVCTFADVRWLQRNVPRSRSRGIVNNSYIGTSYIYVFFSKHCYITICLAFPFFVSSLPPLFDARRGLLTPSVACFVHVCLCSQLWWCVSRSAKDNLMCSRKLLLIISAPMKSSQRLGLTIVWDANDAPMPGEGE